MLKATISGDAGTMAEILQPAHDTGRILAVGISYDRKTKEHFCQTEAL